MLTRAVTLSCLVAPTLGRYAASGLPDSRERSSVTRLASGRQTSDATFTSLLAIRGGARRDRGQRAPEAVSWYQQAGDGGAVSSEALRAVSIAPSFYRVCARGLYLALLFTPMLVTAPFAYPAFMFWFRVWVWYPIVCRTLAWGGAAWIKWAQWASTRPDMFPEQLCAQLASLQTEAPVHSFRFTKRVVSEAFCAPIEVVFDTFPATPIASGSIAQVYKAQYQSQTVAVKVRHPGVAEQIAIDFRLMRAVANWMDRQPMLKWLNLASSVEAFSHTMTGQTRLDIEGDHLQLFNTNFRRFGDMDFPVPLVSNEAVLVESFEKGLLVSEMAKEARASNQRIALDMAHFIVTRGEDLYLKMLLCDNLMHADLHPGNILVQYGGTTSLAELAQEEGRVELAGLFTTPEMASRAARRLIRPPNARVVLVDAGMVANLGVDEQRNFVGFLAALGEGNGRDAGRFVLKWSAAQTCEGAALQAAFIEDMASFFDTDCRGYGTGVDLGHVLRGVLTIVRNHQVRVDVNYATLVMNALCLDGLANSILPEYNVLDAAKPLLRAYARWQKLARGAGFKLFLPLARRVKKRMDRRIYREIARAQEGALAAAGVR